MQVACNSLCVGRELEVDRVDDASVCKLTHLMDEHVRNNIAGSHAEAMPDFLLAVPVRSKSRQNGQHVLGVKKVVFDVIDVPCEPIYSLRVLGCIVVPIYD